MINQKTPQMPTVQVSFRLRRDLVRRLKDAATNNGSWPPPPSQTEIVARGIELVLAKMETKRGRASYQAKA